MCKQKLHKQKCSGSALWLPRLTPKNKFWNFIFCGCPKFCKHYFSMTWICSSLSVAITYLLLNKIVWDFTWVHIRVLFNNKNNPHSLNVSSCIIKFSSESSCAIVYILIVQHNLVCGLIYNIVRQIFIFVQCVWMYCASMHESTT